MLFESIISRTPVQGGWTPDQKYRAEASDGSLYFLRIAGPERAERLNKVFRMQIRASALGLPMAVPLESGDCTEGFYTLETWIEGPCTRSFLPGRTEAECYAHGLEAGRILRRLHTIPVPPELPDWGERFSARLDRKVEAYLACSLKYDHGEAFLKGVAEHRGLLTGRPQCFQHGDYHVGNFLFKDGRLQIIDFDRCGWGDPWQEFDRIPWCAEISPALARGMVDGYFDGAIPEEFWRLLYLYLCCNLLSSLPWAIPYGEKEVRTMRKQADQVLAWYANGIVPTWYTSS